MNSSEIKDLRVYNGYTQAQIAKELGISTRAYIRWETGKSSPSDINLVKLQKIFTETTEGSKVHLTSLDNTWDVDWIPRYAVEASAGGGIVVDQEDVDQWLAMRSDWLTGHGIDASRCVAVKITGDSMSPEVKDHDIVFVDRDSKDVTAREAMFVFRHLGAISCKYLRRTPKHIIVKSVNSEYEAYTIEDSEPEDFEVLGRVFNVTRSYV